MFTGITDHCGKIAAINKQKDHAEIVIETQFTDLELGESIAVDGVCLTVVHFSKKTFTVHVSPETMSVTTTGKLKPGKTVNLERALQMSGRVGGHFVSGHVDQMAEVISKKKKGDYVDLLINGLVFENLPFLIGKGSIAINGVSLTVNETTDEGLHVMLIPHTLKTTNLGKLKKGDKVNIEMDMLAKVIARQLEMVEITARRFEMEALDDDEEVEKCLLH